MKSSSLKADSLLLITALIWGLAFVFQRTSMDHIGPLTFNAVRFSLGSLALIPLIKFRDRQEKPAFMPDPKFKVYLLGGLAAGAVLFAGAALQQAGIVHTTAGKAGFITGLYVVITPIMGLAFRQRAGMGTWIGALIAVSGMYLLSVTEEMTISYGDMLVLIGAFFWSSHMLVIGWLSPKMDPIKLAATQFAACAVFSFAWALATEHISLEGLMHASTAILYCGLGSVGVAYTLQVVAQREANPSHAAIILSMEAVFAALAGWMFLGEFMDERAMVGCGLMLFGMILSQLRP